MFKPLFRVILLSVLCIFLLSYSEVEEQRVTDMKLLWGAVDIPPKIAADYIHTVIDAHRRFYSQHIVDRLAKTQSLQATEDWAHEGTLLLPDQFLLASSQTANNQGIGMRYRLMSLWPINERNAPKSELEKIGLKAVVDNPKEPFTWIVDKGSSQYFQAIYPDFAVAQSCTSCHNNHAKSPRNNFKMGDVMGGIIINLPLGKRKVSKVDSKVLLPPEVVANYIHSVVASHRHVYSKYIVDRLQDKNILRSTENWLQEKALPLPAQFLMETSQVVRDRRLGLDFRLISLQPINRSNGPANEFERVGLEAVEVHPARPYIGQTRLGGRDIFQAIYPDLAVSQGCVSCHNAHPQSPKKDYRMNDVMGGIVVTLYLQ